jgi:flagellin
MSMIINTNISAINAQRNLSVTNTRMSKTLEQLSSGLRINRAADDAAGLAISEKMRAQVRGMQQGLRNAQDGVSMLQTAEGALNEVHNILQRVRELSVQAGNTTLSSNDRQAIGEELVALRSEIDNIAQRTRFNGQNLLNGSLSVSLDEAGSAAFQAVTANNGAAVVSVGAVDVSGAQGNTTYELSATGADLTVSYVDSNGLTVSETVTIAAMDETAEPQVLDFSALGISVTLEHNGDAGGGAVAAADIATALAAEDIVTSGDSNATFRVGSEVGDDISLAFVDMRSTALGSEGSTLNSLLANNDAVSTTAAADTLLQSVDAAIDQVSTFRAQLGARQNQMEAAINSLGVSVENLSASESRIRDADIAQVSSQMVTQQIMQQAGISVLAQANAAPQSVLALL